MESPDSIVIDYSEYAFKWYVILTVATVAYFAVQQVYSRRLQRKLRATAPTVRLSDGWFGFRNLYAMVVEKRVYQMVFWLQQQVGSVDGVGTVETWLAGNPVIITKDPENFKALFATQFDDFGLAGRYAGFKPFLGESVFTMDGPKWKHLRALLRPQFTKEQVGHVQALEPHIQTLVALIRETEGEPFEAMNYFMKFTQDTATEFLFGESFFSQLDGRPGGKPDSFKQQRMRFNDSVLTAMKFSTLRVVLSKVAWLVTPRRYRDACDEIKRFTDIHVARALAYSDDDLDQLTQHSYTILYEFAKVTKDAVVIRDQLLSMLLAGRDTTMSTLSFLWYEITRNPQVYARLRDDIAAHFGVGDDARVDEITFESLKRCEYLKAVINETMRMWPVVPTNTREATRDTTLPRGGGVDGQSAMVVRKHQGIVISVYSTHHDPAVFGPDPDSFRPERWFDPDTRKLAWAFVPFGGGPRVCLGQQFAVTEVAYVTTRLVQEFAHVANADTKYPPDVEAHMGMVLKDKCRLRMW
ncbi:hypothetical protein DIURU_004038 [Diutina rugosa]|uniref:Cytochrome P450 n=1 Tax=Diutina rugosa TaxID=5481 RepID=A0A642UIV0_DIURU|nr:uncharacterized protein DIURU_004038 [Diutina rugosa]KAA8899781.1 hypothetical protein DIURU_004038 [Diutina rugosa]